MQVRVLGDLEVVVEGSPADLGGPKQRALLAILVAADARAVPLEQLIDQVWGEDPPARVEASLQTYVARLRRVLEPHRDARAPATVLRTHAGGYSLDVAPDDVDARRFAELVRTGRARLASDPDGAVDDLTAALDLWRGEPYAGLGGPSLTAEATRLGELRLAAVEDLWDARIRRGEHAEAVAALEQLVRLHPLREGLWALLARALYRSSRQGDALAALRRAREHLADELGVDPGVELRTLEEAILRQDPDLDAVAAPAAAPEPPAPAAAAAIPEPGLFGRDQALETAAAALADAASGRGRTVVVTGEPGIGKSRLTEALTARAAAAGFRVGRGTWEAEECPPLWGWARATSQALGRDGLLDGGEATDAASASFRQADALGDALREGPPTLLVLDDVHWADAGSLRLLRRFASEVAGLPVVLVVALRDVEPDGALADVLASLARLDPVRVELGGLDAAAIADWVAEHVGVRVSPEVAAELAARTDGNPFYVTELVRLLVSEGALATTGSAAWRSVPSGVRDVVRQRLAPLPGPTVEVLTTAAVLGRSFDVPVLEGVHDPEVVADALETAQVLGLVEEESPGRYRFAHALVRDAVYDGLTAAARARRHAQVANALEQHHAGRVAQHAAELAEHYRLAGPAHVRSAWVFARRAAQHAADESAHDEALRFYDDALRLQDQDPTVESSEREPVLVGLARATVQVGRPLEAWPFIARAGATALERGDAAAAAGSLLAITDGLVWGWRAHPEYDDDAIALWERVLEAQPADDEVTRALLKAGLAIELYYRPGSAERSTLLAEEAVAAARRSGTSPRDRLQVSRMVQMAWLRPDLVHRRGAVADETIELAASIGDAAALAAGLTGRAQDRTELGRLDEAHSDLVRAHQIARQHHLSQNLMVSGWSLAVRQQLDEDWDGAERTIADLEAFQATLAMAGQGIGLAQLAVLREVQGRLGELVPVLAPAAPYHPMVRDLHLLALLRAGAVDEARLAVGGWREQPEVTFDYMWLLGTALRAQVWLGLDDRDALGDLRAALAPYRDRLAASCSVAFFGSVAQTLGELDLALGEVGAARDHLVEARRVHDALGLPAWVRRSDEALARLAAVTTG